MKRHLALIATAALALTSVAGCGSGGSGDGDAIKIRYVTDQSPEIGLGKNIQWWANEINERTDGRVEFQFYWSGSLVATDGLMDHVGSGQAEMGWLSPAYFPEQFPLYMASNIPFITDNAVARAEAWSTAYEENDKLRAEVDENGIVLLTFDPQGPTAAAFTEPVTSLDDMEGKRIRAVGFLANSLSEAGAQTVSIPFGEVYEGLERGTLDASSSVTMEAMGGVSIYEAAPHLLDIGAGTYMTFGSMANKEWYEGLPPDIRDTIDEVSSEYTEHAIGTLEELEWEACESFKEAGSVTRLPDSDVEEFQEIGREAAVNAWLDLATSSGIDEAEAQEFLDEHIEKVRTLEEEMPYTGVLQQCASGN